jgi:hypothetical protein
MSKLVSLSIIMMALTLVLVSGTGPAAQAASKFSPGCVTCSCLSCYEPGRDMPGRDMDKSDRAAWKPYSHNSTNFGTDYGDDAVEGFGLDTARNSLNE